MQITAVKKTRYHKMSKEQEQKSSNDNELEGESYHERTEH